MRQNAWKLTILSGLMLATSVACSDRTASRAPTATANTPAPTPAATEEPRTYTVAPGDFLSDIAAQLGVELDALVAANNITDPSLIEVGQVLIIPGSGTSTDAPGLETTVADPAATASTGATGTESTPGTEATPGVEATPGIEGTVGTDATVADPFFAAAPAEQWPEIYPPPALPPPPPPTPLEQLRDRIAAWPWPPRETMVQGGVIAGFAITALVVGLMLTSAVYRARRWGVRAAPRAARRTLRGWGHAALAPRRAAGGAWRRSKAAAHHTGRAGRALDRRYRGARTAVIRGWERTEAHRERFATWSKPIVDRAVERGHEVFETVRERAPGAADALSDRATVVGRTVASSAQRARRDVFEPPPVQRWRSPGAADLATAFEDDQLHVRYVPVIDLAAHTLSAVEAQLYWQHPSRGLLEASDISVAAEGHPELNAALLEFLLQQSCKFVNERVDSRYPSAQLIVPVTLEQIIESEPLAAIDRGLSSSGLALDRLKVEISETDALQDPLTATAFVRNLRSMGLGVHLSDYGLATTEDLRQLGVSSVTVEFTTAVTRTEARGALTDVIEAAQDLRLPITARHVNNPTAKELQVSLGCSFEAVGEPLPADNFIAQHVDEPAPAPAPADIPGGPAGALPAVDGASPAATASTAGQRARRPGAPLRLSQPALRRPNLSQTSTIDTPADSDTTLGEGALPELTDERPEAVDAEAPSSDGSSGRPVDAA